MPLVAVLAAGTQEAQERPVRWTLERVDSGVVTAGPGQDAAALHTALRATVDRGWYLYAQEQPPGGPTPLRIFVAGPFEMAAPVEAPRPRVYADRNFDLFTQIYRQSEAFGVTVRPRGGAGELQVLVTFQTCNDRYCLPARTDTLTLDLGATPDGPPSPERRDAATARDPGPTRPGTGGVDAPVGGPKRLPSVPEDPGDAAGTLAVGATDDGGPAGADLMPAGSDAPPLRRGAAAWPGTADPSLPRFLWLAAVMGVLSLLTPCVFPMVPITVGFFSHRAGRGTAVRTVGAFGAGIVATFTGLGMLVSVLVGAGGVVRLAANPWMNLAVAALFVLFALNLLGVWDLRLPRRLMQGAGTAASGRTDAAAALLMGGAFSVTSFTCTAPFVGTLLVLSAQGGWRWPLLGMVVYAVAFALPFVVLGLAPDRMARLPRAGPWMKGLMTTLAVVELAAAVKFISNADLVWRWGIFTRDVVILCWMTAAMALVVLFLRGVRRSPLPRIVAAGAALAAVIWLAGGLRGYRLGELEAFLPPAPEGLLLARAGAGELPWRLNDYTGSVAASKAAGRPLFIDFTGYTCTNCRWMEANMFPRDEVRALLARYERVRLYTDGRGEPYEAQQRLQERLYGTVALPYYAVLAPEGRTVATFLGMTRDTRDFVQFLEDGLGLPREAPQRLESGGAP